MHCFSNCSRVKKTTAVIGSEPVSKPCASASFLCLYQFSIIVFPNGNGNGNFLKKFILVSGSKVCCAMAANWIKCEQNSFI